MQKKTRTCEWIWFAGLIVVAAGYKIWLIAADLVPFNADEAIVGLMARHILEGEKPIFFYGQAYMGSLDAFLVAGGFLAFGQQVWVIRLVQAVLYLLIIISTVFCSRLLFGSMRAGLIAASLLAIPTVNLTLYTTVSLGGYGEALLIGNLIFMTTWLLVKAESISNFRRKSVPGLFGFGLLIGIGVWANGLTLAYSIPAIVILLNDSFRKRPLPEIFPAVIPLILGGLLGSLPIVVFLAQNGAADLVGEYLGQAVAVESAPLLQQTGAHLINYLLFGWTVLLGLRPPWEVTWLGLPLIPFVLMIWGAIGFVWVGKAVKPGNHRKAYGLFGLFAVVFSAAFIFTPFGVDPSGRYFLPFGIILCIVAGAVLDAWVRAKPAAWAILCLLIGYNLWGNLQCASVNPPGFTTQFYGPARLDMRFMGDLVDFLEKNSELRGYTNYWIAYPLAFISDEKIIYTPVLPYHPDLRYTPRDNRYRPYNDMLDKAERIAYITSKNPRLDERIASAMQSELISWEEKLIGDFRVYYNLSAPLDPALIDLSMP